MPEHASPNWVCPLCLPARDAFGDARLLAEANDVVLRNDDVIAGVSPHWRPDNPGPGHVLIVPIRLHENTYTPPPDTRLAVFEASRRVAIATAIAIAMKQADRCAGVSARRHDEPAGSGEVGHFHRHVFPHHAGDQRYENHANRLQPAARLRGTPALS